MDSIAAPAANHRASLTGGESAAHRELKRLAVTWALAHRLVLCGTEVRLPRSGYRADVAAAMPRVTLPSACTAVFECKASREDFRRDAAVEAATAAQVTALRVRLAALREAIGGHRPDLRCGDELFAMFEAVDLRGVRHDTHRRLTRELQAAETRLFDGTKFSRLTRWRSASLFYLVVEPDLVAPAELPDGWGLLVRDGENLLLRAKPCLHETTSEERIAFVERIAAAASAGVRRSFGLKWPETRDGSSRG
ncbi:MAG TPA: hypothetical protein VHO24_05285 [Opitutaceae bacterium]|nr:hypothetical protein [Opitutaceae bacterium]